MATVKFISECKCLLYIDTEFIDVLEPHHLKRVELGIGSYLIEIKNIDNVLVQSYALNVNEGESQLLQQVLTEVECIEDVLNNLKNDYRIRFFNQRLRFKHNNKYGYVNSRYEIVINPEFTEAEDFVRNKALVKKRFSDTDKLTIIDTEGNLCYERWFDYIGEDNDTILLHHDYSYFTIDKIDYSIINEYKGINYNQKDPYIPVSVISGIDEMCGFINRAGKEVIPFIYDGVQNFEESGFAKVMRFGNERAIDRDGNLYYSFEEALKDGKVDKDGKLHQASKISCEDSIQEDYMGNLGSSSNGLYGDPEFWIEQPMKIGKYWGLLGPIPPCDEEDDNENKEKLLNELLFPCERIFYYTKGYFAFRVNNECKLLFIEEPEKIYNFKYDGIYPVVSCSPDTTTGYRYDEYCLLSIIVYKNKKYGLVDLVGNEILPVEYDKIEITDALCSDVSGKIGIIWKNNKCALINFAKGRILGNIVFDEIRINDPLQAYTSDSTFMVRIGNKYGCIDFDSKEIVPVKFNQIDFRYNNTGICHFSMKLYLDNKVGTYEYYRSVSDMGDKSFEYYFSTNVEYDDCEFLESENSVAAFGHLSYIAVCLKGKWGILDVTPAWASYHPIDDSDWDYHPNLDDLVFKYESLDALKKEAEEEFERRYNKYYRPYLIIDMGGGVYVKSVPSYPEES